MDTGIPRPALCCAEACAIGAGMSKRSVNDARLWNAKNQFVRADCCRFATFSDLPLIGGRANLAQIRENVFRQLQRCQNTPTLAIFFRNQPVCAKILNVLDVSQLPPATRSIEQVPDLLHSGNALSNHKIERSSPTE